MQAKIAAAILLVLIVSFFLFARLPVEHIRAQQQNQVRTNTPTVSLHAPLPDFAGIHDIKKRKNEFFSFLLPLVHHANDEILQARNRIISLQKQLSGSSLAIEDSLWLALVAEHYRVSPEDGFNEDFFNRLLRRVDLIPPSLVLAQAATESGWGTSRFAREGNNLFGEYCYSPGCGLIPSRRNPGARHELTRFSSPYASVLSYMNNLNRHDSYLGLRKQREQARVNNQALHGSLLAEGLIRYSERGKAYIRQIQSMIQHNQLSRFDEVLVADN